MEQVNSAAAVTAARPRAAAIAAIRAELAAPTEAALVSACSGSAPWDQPHQAAFSGWTGPVHTLQPQLGHPFAVLGGWQCVLACELLSRDLCRDAVVAADTGAQQAVAAWFSCVP